MNSKLIARSILLLSMFVMLSSCAMFHKDSSADRVKRAERISSAFANASSTAWRIDTVRELVAIRTMPTMELDGALFTYRGVVEKRGAQGLEPLVLASVSELASRGYYESQRAQDHLRQLRTVYRIDDKVSGLPNAYAPIMRPQNRLVHYVPLATVRAMLQRALILLNTGQNKLTAGSLCSDASILEFRLRWGDDKANVLEELCRGDNANAAIGTAFPGIASGISSFDCEISQEPTRAERLTNAMQACLQSMVTHGGGNPLTTGSPSGSRGYSIFNDIFPLRKTVDTKKEENQAKLDQEHAIDIFTDYDNSGAPIKDTVFKADGSVDRNYYDEDGNLALKEHVDKGQGGTSAFSSGGISSIEAYGPTGQVEEKVTFNKDGGYTVERPSEDYHKRYDVDGKPVNENSGDESPQPPESSDPNEWGATNECRALTLVLAEEKLSGDLESDGILSPKLVNPNPETGGEDGEGVPCSASINISIDSAMSCNQLVICPGITIANETCGCGQALPAVTSGSSCKYTIMCSDGKVGTEDPQTGTCTCNTDESPVFIDPWTGGGPEPEPIKGVNQKDPFTQ